MNRSLTRIVVDWGARAFGAEHMRDPRVRALRLAEEVVELAQALGVPHGQLRDVIDIVYSRPVGGAYQEVGGTMVCLAVLCDAIGVDPDEALETEVRRVLSKPGWRGYPTIEISNHTDVAVEIPAGAPIGQMEFALLDAPTEQPYSGKYQDQPQRPVEAISEK